uniref:Uncharacterized protein n=1 Tax=Anguilla anguilla TaxID=7936 RepID=A0A0E9T544_ANGAN
MQLVRTGPNDINTFLQLLDSLYR